MYCQVDGKLMIRECSRLNLLAIYSQQNCQTLSSAHVYEVKCNDPPNKLYFQSSMNQSVPTEQLFPTIFDVCLYVILCGYECS